MEKFNATKVKGIYHYALRKPIERIILDGVREYLQEAKKKVFDDIDKFLDKFGTDDNSMKDEPEYKKLKKRHLSTFPKEKRHN